MQKKSSKLTSEKSFYLSLPPMEQKKGGAFIKPEFFFLKNKKKKNKTSTISSSKLLKFIAVIEIIYVTIGYFADMWGLDDYAFVALLVFGEVLSGLEKGGIISLPDTCFFSIDDDSIQYHFETGVRDEFVKLGRIVGFSKPKKVYFKNIESVELQLRGIRFKQKNGKAVVIELFPLGDQQLLIIQDAVKEACERRGIPVTISELSKNLREKLLLE